jgi:pimeloyl-ACP methyl ester carboxylesterase
VFKRFKQGLDRWAINAATAALPAPAPNPAQINEINAILARPDFFVPTDQVANVRFANRFEFDFDSPVQLCCPENNRGHGWFMRTSGDWRSRPVVILIHGWNAQLHYEMLLPRLARRLRRMGINSLAFELPLHSQRRPGKEHPVGDFISDEVPTMLGATRQALADIHALLLWAKKEGCPKVACWGFSLGGWLSGLYGTVTNSADALVLTTPVTSMSEAIRDLPFCHPIRETLKVAPFPTHSLDLENRPLLIPPQNLLLQEGAYDSFIKRSTFERLAAAWHLQHWQVLKESHISILVSRSSMKAAAEWVQPRLA